MSRSAGPSLTFDELNRLRVFEPEFFKQTSELAEDAQNFTDKISTFSQTVEELVQLLQAEGEKIEQEKLKAIGQRNRLESETEGRKKKQSELQHEIKQKQQGIHRLNEYLESLTKLEMEQKAIMEKLNKQ
jgi:intraflagellar transport protein 20